MEKPSWGEGLRPCGTYFEGFVDDATTIVEKCKADTLTTFGTRTSRMIQGDSSKSSDKENSVSSSKITPLQLCCNAPKLHSLSIKYLLNESNTVFNHT